MRGVCSFDQTLENLRKLKALGVEDVAMCVAGWQTGGYDGRAPAVFPVAPEAGGEEGLRRLIAGAKALGYIIDAQDNYTDCYTVSPMWDGGNIACRGPNGKLDFNGSWCGGGFHSTPLALLDDGVMDVLLIKKVSRLQVAQVIGKYKNGRYRELPHLVTHRKTKGLTVRCDRPTPINLDGELRTAETVTMSVAEEKIRFFYPKGLVWQTKELEKV